MNRTLFTKGLRQPMTDEMLRKAAPSIFAERQHESRSERYSFIPTIRLVDTMREANWIPVNASEQRIVGEDKELRQGFQKHIIKFQSTDSKALEKVGDVVPEVVVTNSHNGSSAFTMMAGLFRLACTNGLMVAEASLAHVHIRHTGYTDDAVRQGAEYMEGSLPNVLARVEDFRRVNLTEHEQVTLAISAAMAKWRVDEPGMLPFDPGMLLKVRRYDDQKQDLWTVFNRIQENLLSGGIKYVQEVEQSDSHRVVQKRHTTRPILGINEDLRVNSALWLLAENMRRIKIGEKIITK